MLYDSCSLASLIRGMFCFAHDTISEHKAFILFPCHRCDNALLSWSVSRHLAMFAQARYTKLAKEYRTDFPLLVVDAERLNTALRDARWPSTTSREAPNELSQSIRNVTWFEVYFARSLSGFCRISLRLQWGPINTTAAGSDKTNNCEQ